MKSGGVRVAPSPGDCSSARAMVMMVADSDFVVFRRLSLPFSLAQWAPQRRRRGQPQDPSSHMGGACQFRFNSAKAQSRTVSKHCTCFVHRNSTETASHSSHRVQLDGEPVAHPINSYALSYHLFSRRTDITHSYPGIRIILTAFFVLLIIHPVPSIVLEIHFISSSHAARRVIQPPRSTPPLRHPPTPSCGTPPSRHP